MSLRSTIAGRQPARRRQCTRSILGSSLHRSRSARIYDCNRHCRPRTALAVAGGAGHPGRTPVTRWPSSTPCRCRRWRYPWGSAAAPRFHRAPPLARRRAGWAPRIRGKCGL